MKKFLLLIASVLLLYGSGFAGSPPDGNGTVSVEVVKHLELEVLHGEIWFTYNEFNANNGNPPNNTADVSTVNIKTNVDWKFGVKAVENVLINTTKPSETMNVGLFQYSSNLDYNLITTLSSTNAFPIAGLKDTKTFILSWSTVNPNGFTENYYAGNYVVELLYQLMEN